MVDSNEESLRGYVARIMKEKGLRVRDIRRRSAGTITESYVSEILKGVSSNASIEKLAALGRGLGVDPVDLFTVASGAALRHDESRKVVDRAYALNILDMMRRIALSPDLVGIIQEVAQLSDSDVDLAQQSLKNLRASGSGHH